MGMYVCEECHSKYPKLVMANIINPATCEVCNESSICKFTWDLDRFGEDIKVQLKGK